MTPQEQQFVLEWAVRTAIERDFMLFDRYHVTDFKVIQVPDYPAVVFYYNQNEHTRGDSMMRYAEDRAELKLDLPAILFSRAFGNFPRALFGSSPIFKALHSAKAGEMVEMKKAAEFAWEYHVQQLAICDDQITYLSRYLDS